MLRSRRLGAWAGAASALALTVTDAAEAVARLGYRTGNAVYQIGGRVRVPEGDIRVHFPISELDFPMEVWTGAAGVEVGLGRSARLSLLAGGNIEQDAGIMKDSDWLNPRRPRQLDIYSESHSDLESFWGDAWVGMAVLSRPNWTLEAGLGLRYEDWAYQCRMIRQWSPSGEYDADMVGDGSVALTYDLATTMPYVSLGMELRFDPRASARVRADVAPWVRATDKDVHLLRDPPITAEGTYDGVAVRFAGEGRYRLTARWSALLAAEALGLEADGEQRNTENGVWTHTTEAELSVSEFTLWAGVGCDL